MGGMSRRGFLRCVMCTGGVAAGASGARLLKQYGKLIPYVVPPEHVQPGEWSWFATTCRECPAGCGMHVGHRDGRVTKAEGHP